MSPLRAALVALVLPGCFREAPPCDQASFDALAETCVRDGLDAVACSERLNEREHACVKRVRDE